MKSLQSSFGIKDMKLSREEINNIIDMVIRNMPHEECRTCDCFLGFITQLDLDSSEDVRDITDKFKPPKDQIHGCLGCNPCPPAEAYTNYLQQKHGSKVGHQHCNNSDSYSHLVSIANKQKPPK